MRCAVLPACALTLVLVSGCAGGGAGAPATVTATTVVTTTVVVQASETARARAAVPAATTPADRCTTDLGNYPDLSPGSHGAPVRAFQCLLVQQGARVPVDGVYGDATRRAYQQVAVRHGFEAWVPQVETHVWTLLLSQGPTTTVRRGDESPDVARLQRVLVAQGSRISIDGVFGRRTEEAVRDLQTSLGQRPTGVWDAEMWQLVQHGGPPTG